MRTYFIQTGLSLFMVCALSFIAPIHSYAQTDFLAESDIIAPDGLNDELGGALDYQDENKPSIKNPIPTPLKDDEKPKIKPVSSAILTGTVQGLINKDDGIIPALKGSAAKSYQDGDDFEKANGKKPTFAWKLLNLIENTFFTVAPVVIEKVVTATISVLLTRLTA